MDLPPPIGVLRWYLLTGSAEPSHHDQELHVQMYIIQGSKGEANRNELPILPQILKGPASMTPERVRRHAGQQAEAGGRGVLGLSSLERFAPAPQLPPTQLRHTMRDIAMTFPHLTPPHNTPYPRMPIQLHPHIRRLNFGLVVDVLIQ